MSGIAVPKGINHKTRGSMWIPRSSTYYKSESFPDLIHSDLNGNIPLRKRDCCKIFSAEEPATNLCMFFHFLITRIVNFLFVFLPWVWIFQVSSSSLLISWCLTLRRRTLCCQMLFSLLKARSKHRSCMLAPGWESKPPSSACVCRKPSRVMERGAAWSFSEEHGTSTTHSWIGRLAGMERKGRNKFCSWRDFIQSSSM